MSVIYSFHLAPHPLTQDPKDLGGLDLLCVPAGMFRFLRERVGCKADFVALARCTVRNEYVGIVRTYRRGSTTLRANGTWVCPKDRDSGIARKLWLDMLDKTSAQRVEVSTMTRAGTRFIRSLQNYRADIEFVLKREHA